MYDGLINVQPPCSPWITEERKKNREPIDVTAKILMKNLQNTCLHTYSLFFWLQRRRWKVSEIVDILFSFYYLIILVQSHEAEEKAATGRSRVMTLQENSSYNSFAAHRIFCYLLNCKYLRMNQSREGYLASHWDNIYSRHFVTKAARNSSSGRKRNEKNYHWTTNSVSNIIYIGWFKTNFTMVFQMLMCGECYENICA
jgi:hypothetical protein